MALPSSQDEVLLLHNPRCSKSRATAALLTEQGVAFTERLYLEDPLTAAELAELGRRLGRPAREWVRRGERAFAEAGLDLGAEEATLFAAMERAPILMERPIVVRAESARVGRPPADVLELFEEQ